MAITDDSLLYSSEAAACSLQSRCEALQRRGHAVAVAVYSVGGDADVRMQICDAGGAPVLEILGPCSTSPDGGIWWDAVCLCPEGQRAVCRGPLQCCSEAEFVRFVEDLLAGKCCARLT